MCELVFYNNHTILVTPLCVKWKLGKVTEGAHMPTDERHRPEICDRVPSVRPVCNKEERKKWVQLR